MFDPTTMIPANGFEVVLTLYWVCLVVGGGLLLISTVLGGHADADADFGFDADVSVDADLSVDTDVGVDADVSADVGGAASLASWFSIHFAIYFMAAFGLVGIVCSYYTGLGGVGVLATSMVSGLVVGQLVHQIMRHLRRSSGNSAAQTEDYVNQLARVTIAIEPRRKGEIALRVRRRERFVPAMAKHEDGAFDRGEMVAVVGYSSGVAEVISRKEYDFLTDSGKGDQS